MSSRWTLPDCIQETVNVDDSLLALDFNSLAARIEASGDTEAIALVAHNRERIAQAGCTPCEMLAAAAQLRMWIVERGER